MNKKLPIIIIVPHGGDKVPEELSGFEDVDKFDLFFESDTCANELFDFENHVIANINSNISRLFVDLDRPLYQMPQKSLDGVIKKVSLTGKKIYKEKIFPDEIAISNILKRYYIPFHKKIETLISSNDIKFIIECHTVMAVGPKNSSDYGKPRPLIIIENRKNDDKQSILTCPDEHAKSLLESLKKTFSDEDTTVAGRFSFNRPSFNGYILKKYGCSEIPMLRMSISKSLFLNDNYFSYEYLKVDDLRIEELRKKIWSSISHFVNKYI